jgi:hypothetical protein
MDIAQLQHAPEPSRNRAPVLAIVTAHAAHRPGGNSFLGPAPRSQRKMKNRAKNFGIARLQPDNAANLCVDVRGNERANRCVMAREAESEVILQLLAMVEVWPVNVARVGEDAKKASGRVTEFNETPGLGRREAAA